MTSKIVPIEKYQDRFAAIAQSDDDFPVDFDEAWKWVGYAYKTHAKRSLTASGFSEGIDFKVFTTKGENPKGGRPTEKIMLTVDCFKQFCMMAGTERGKQVRLYFIEIEKRYKSILHNDSPMPDWVKEIMAKIANAQELISGKTNQRIEQVETGIEKVKQDVGAMGEALNVCFSLAESDHARINDLEERFEAFASDMFSEIIYFVQEQAMGYIKVGYCDKDRFPKRLQEIEREYRTRIKVLLTIPGNRRQESAFHAVFAKHKVSDRRWGTEFFKPDKEILKFINKEAKKSGYQAVSTRRKRNNDEGNFIQASLF